MKIFITGINGFLGSHLAQYWIAAGHTVRGTARSGSGPVVSFSLGDCFPPASLTGFDVIVHGAYDSRGSVELNVSGTRAICDAAEQAGVPYQVYIGSYAARPEAQAAYGRMKWELERYFLDRGHTVVRPGLVIGNGGLFGRNLRKMLQSPVIPLLDGGQDLIPVVAVEDFVKAMDALVERRGTGVFNLFNRELAPMRTVVETVCKVAGRRPILVKVPLGLALVLLTLAEKLHVPFPAGTDNVRSLKQSLPHVYESDLEKLIDNPCSFQNMIESAVRNELASRRGNS